MYLAALYFICGNNKKSMSHGKNATLIGQKEYIGSKSNTIWSSDLVILDDFARVCGFQALHTYVTKNHLTSLQNLEIIIKKSQHCVGQIRSSLHTHVKQLRQNAEQLSCSMFTRYPTERNLLALHLSQELRCSETNAYPIKLYGPRILCAKEPSLVKGTKKVADVVYSLDDELSDLLRKYAIQCFTDYHLADNNIEFFFNDKCRVFSHYKALHFYQQKRYDEALKVCDRVLEEEVSWDMFAPNFITETRFQHFLPVPVTLAFQIMFGNDISSIIGLMTLIDRDLTIDKAVLNSMSGMHLNDIKRVREFQQSRFLGDIRTFTGDDYYKELFENWPAFGYAQRMFDFFGTKVKQFLTMISPQFLVLYVRAECVIHLNCPKHEIYEALESVKFRNCVLVFERIISTLLRRKYLQMKFGIVRYQNT